MAEDIKITLLHTALSSEQALAFVEDPTAGGIVTFVGNVRNHSQGKEVHYLEFEAYEAMAIKVMDEIAQEMRAKFPIHKIYTAHRLGKVSIGESAVIIAVSASHRAEAFDATEYMIDQLKARVPIWKKEYWVDGSHWVNAHP
ncbi:MAG: molybdenum cofactor biosynthesis protein MoaE [Saprospiraceae bacterium]